MRSILLIACLLGIVLLIVFAVVDIKKHEIKDYYDPEAGYARIFQLENEIDELTPLACDLAVIDENTRSSDLDFDAEAGLFVDCSDVITKFAANPFEKLEPASTTKIMTALIALKYGKLTDQVVVSEDTLKIEPGSSIAGIKPGQTLSLEQLIYGLMLPSGNDCANAIATYIAGDVQSFVEMMNMEAQKLGAVDTKFSNAHGIHDDNHFTTAYDLYLIVNEALKYDKFRDVCRTKTYVAEFFDVDGLAISKTWENTNRYITGEEELPENLKVIGGKTGTTMAAGNCLVLATQDDAGRDYISIVLKASGKDNLYKNMDDLLNKYN